MDNWDLSPHEQVEVKDLIARSAATPSATSTIGITSNSNHVPNFEGPSVTLTGSLVSTTAQPAWPSTRAKNCWKSWPAGGVYLANVARFLFVVVVVLLRSPPCRAFQVTRYLAMMSFRPLSRCPRAGPHTRCISWRRDPRPWDVHDALMTAVPRISEVVRDTPISMSA